MARIAGMSITPSPGMPRSNTRSVVGTSQSQTWKRGDAALGAGHLAGQVGVPPDVVDVDRDADAFAERVAEVERLAERGEDAAVGAGHRVQRLEREGDAGGAGVRQDGFQAVPDHLARARAGRASPAAGRRRP